MKTILTILLLSFTMTTPMFAQEVDWDRYEVGVDLLWLIDKNNAPFSVFAKRLELKQKKNDFGFILRGYRLRVGGYYSTPEQTVFPQGANAYSLRERYYSMTLRPGYEWHRKIKSYDLYYGGDMTFRMGGTTHTSYFYLYDDGTGNIVGNYFNRDDRSIEIGLSPVAGLSIRILRGLNLTLESMIEVAYRLGRTNYSNNSGIQNLRVETRAWQIHLAPLYTVNASFSF